MANKDETKKAVTVIDAVLSAFSRLLEANTFDEVGHFAPSEKSYLNLQRAKFQFRKQTRFLRDEYEVRDALQKLAFFIEENDDLVHYLATHGRSKIRLVITDRLHNATVHPALLVRGELPVADAWHFLRQSVSTLTKNMRWDEGQLNSGQTSLELRPKAIENARYIKRIVPEQKVSPLKFDIVDGRLTIDRQKYMPKANGKEIASSAREVLIGQNEAIMTQLKRSNCDFRIIENFERIGSLLNGEFDIIQLGLANITCQKLCDTFRRELPDALCALMDGHATGIGMYVGQFKEWQNFVENAAEAFIDKVAQENIQLALRDFIDELQLNEAIVEPIVIRSLQNMASHSASSDKGSANISFAIVRTFENITAKVFSWIADVSEQTLVKTKEKIADWAATGIVFAMAAVGLAAAAPILPLTDSVKGLEWVETAYNIIKADFGR